MRRIHARVALAAVTTVVLSAGALAAPAQAAPRKPILTSWANPGVAVTDEGFVMLRTARWDKPVVGRTATKARGPWKKTGQRLLRPAPTWVNGSRRTVWAPSIIQGGNGRWVVYYSALVRGSKHTRCIGTGTADTRVGPFVPDPRPITCWKGTRIGSQDPIGGARRISIIDATPAVVNGQTVLTFKTERSYKNKQRTTIWDTSIRMLNLDPQSPNRVIANPVNQQARSVQLTRKRSKYIEENPSLVQRGSTFTLFTSWGWYGTPHYWTQYRQSGNPWRFAAKPTRLRFPKGTNTLGRGNAQVVSQPRAGRWWIFWNGHRPNYRRGEGPKYLYVGEVDWYGNGKPYVKRVLQRT